MQNTLLASPYLTLWIIFTHTSDTKCGSVLHPTADFLMLWTPAEVSIKSHRWRAQSHKTAPTLNANHKSRLWQVFLTGYEFKGFHDRSPLQVWQCSRMAHRTQGSTSLLYYKGHSSVTAKWRRQITQVGLGLGSMELPCWVSQFFHVLTNLEAPRTPSLRGLWRFH